MDEPVRPSTSAPLIAHLNLARNYRGGERQVELLVTDLNSAREFRSYAICRKGEILAERMRAAGREVDVVAKPFSWRARLRPDTRLIHAHDGKSVHVAHSLSRRYGIPYVVTRRVDNPIGTGRRTRRAYRGARCVVTLSRAIESVVHRLDPSLPTEIIASASSSFRPDAKEVDRIRHEVGGRRIIGHVGALQDKQKGQSDIIAIAKRLRDPRPDICFLLVGGDGGDEETLRAQANGLDNVVFAGHVDNVGDYLSAFDLMLFPSRNEGLGSSVIDALSLGIPVVAYRIGGIPEIINDGANGLLVPPRDIDGLERAMIDILADDNRRRSMGSEARRTAENYSSSAMAQRYAALYRRVLA